MAFLKIHWLSILLAVLAFLSILHGVNGFLDGHIWVGGRSNYKLIVQDKTPTAFWIAVSFSLLLGGVFAKISQWLYRFEKSMNEQGKPKKKKKP